MHKLVEQFRHSTRDRHKNGPPTARYSGDQRQMALGYLDWARKQGINAKQVADDLGVDSNTLRSWEKRADADKSNRRRSRKMMPVRIAKTTNGTADSRAPFVVRITDNASVECASAANAVELLQLLA